MQFEIKRKNAVLLSLFEAHKNNSGKQRKKGQRDYIFQPPTRTVRILHGMDVLVVVKVVQQGREYPPARVELVVAHKVRVVALQRVEDERLVGLGDLEVREAAPVRQIELRHHRLHAEAWQLRVHLDVHALVRLHADDELVPRDVLEDARRDILELDAHLGLLLVEGCKDAKRKCLSKRLDVCLQLCSSLSNLFRPSG